MPVIYFPLGGGGEGGRFFNLYFWSGGEVSNFVCIYFVKGIMNEKCFLKIILCSLSVCTMNEAFVGIN